MQPSDGEPGMSVAVTRIWPPYRHAKPTARLAGSEDISMRFFPL